MKIAFEMNGALRRSNLQEVNTIIEFIKILKNAGHFIIIWADEDIIEIKKFVKENQLEDYVDLAVSKLYIKSDDLPDLAFDVGASLHLAKSLTIRI